MEVDICIKFGWGKNLEKYDQETSDDMTQVALGLGGFELSSQASVFKGPVKVEITRLDMNSKKETGVSILSLNHEIWAFITESRRLKLSLIREECWLSCAVEFNILSGTSR